jgi:glucose/arabinose dehydrogenase
MKKILTLSIIISCVLVLESQTFTRSQLPTRLITPWEITYGPDGYLWITDSGGAVVRVHPTTGAKTVVYTAPDYYPGSWREQLQLCFQPNIGSGTLGLDLHPQFMTPATSFIYYVYSYNSTGDTTNPVTRFKIVRLKWQASSNSVIDDSTLVTGMPTGYDHLGGRLMVIPQNDTNYIFFTVGDNGISETNSPTCYNPQSSNPNNFAQDPSYKTGKVHRFNLDGSIPAGNPIQGNSLYTRGHRNPQGLMYNPNQEVIYDIEHGDRSDDEINVLEKGMNYGWKWVRGYHGDNNFPGESDFILNYVPDSTIAGDALRAAFYSWCATAQSSDTEYLNWCTVAPSDGIYYGSTGIPQWTNSLLVVTLKNGLTTDNEVYRFKLNENGSLMASTGSDPNPVKFFGSDQALNGRLRDIAVSPDGTKIYLVNNNTPMTHDSIRITVYTYNSTGIREIASPKVNIHPNPANTVLMVSCSDEIAGTEVYNLLGEQVISEKGNVAQLNVSGLNSGFYIVRFTMASGAVVTEKFARQ